MCMLGTNSISKTKVWFSSTHSKHTCRHNKKTALFLGSSFLHLIISSSYSSNNNYNNKSNNYNNNSKRDVFLLFCFLTICRLDKLDYHLTLDFLHWVLSGTVCVLFPFGDVGGMWN